MLRLIYLVFFLLLSLTGIAQFNKTYSTNFNYSWFNADRNQNIYAVSGDLFIKLIPPYDSSYQFNLQKEGKPSGIDINNPNEIVLFYQATKKVILLDSNLNEIIRPFYLEEVGMYDVSLIFSTGDQGLWFYNNYNNSLSKLDKNFLLSVRSVNLNPYFLPPNVPDYVCLHENKIFINVPSIGILVLGPGGEYQTAMHLPGLIDFQVDSKAVYFYRDNIIYCYNYRTMKFKKIYIPTQPDILNAWFFEKTIIMLTKNGFTVYNHEINPLN